MYYLIAEVVEISLGVQKISSQQIAFQGVKPNPKACESGIQEVQKNASNVNCISIAGLLGWAMLLIGLIGGITHGVVETVKDKHNSEICTEHSDTVQGNTIDYKNV